MKMIRHLLFFAVALIIFSSINVNAQDQDKIILNGLDDIYSFKFDEAVKTFTAFIKNNPEDPRGYHYLSEIYLWYYLGGKNKDDLNAFITNADITIEKCNNILKEKPEDEKTLLLIGTTYTFKSVILSQSKSYVDAAWAGNKSESFLNKVIELNKSNYDAYFGLGLFKFAVSQIPSTFQWVLKMAGIKGDKNLGLKFIKEAAIKGKYYKTEAQYFLAQLMSAVLNNNTESLSILTSLNKKYPGNYVFSYAAAVINMKKHNLGKAEELLQPIAELNNNRLAQIISFAKFLMGDINFRRNEFAKAISWYNKFLDSAPENDYKGIAVYRLALSTEINGNRELSTHYYLVCDQGNKDIEDDIYAKRKGALQLENPLTPMQIELIKGVNTIHTGNYENAIEILEGVAKSNTQVSAEAEYYLSEAFYYLNNYDESLKHSLAVLELKSDEKWIFPYACYNAARVYKSLNDFEKMDDMISRAEDFSDYDYENNLKNLLGTIK